MHFGFALDFSDTDLLNTDLLDQRYTHLDLLDTDIPSKHFICFQDVLKASSRHALKKSSRYVFKMSSRHVFKTSSRHVFKKSSRHIFKTSSRHVFKTSWRRLMRNFAEFTRKHSCRIFFVCLFAFDKVKLCRSTASLKAKL